MKSEKNISDKDHAHVTDTAKKLIQEYLASMGYSRTLEAFENEEQKEKGEQTPIQQYQINSSTLIDESERSVSSSSSYFPILNEESESSTSDERTSITTATTDDVNNNKILKKSGIRGSTVGANKLKNSYKSSLENLIHDYKNLLDNQKSEQKVIRKKIYTTNSNVSLASSNSQENNNNIINTPLHVKKKRAPSKIIISPKVSISIVNHHSGTSSDTNSINTTNSGRNKNRRETMKRRTRIRRNMRESEDEDSSYCSSSSTIKQQRQIQQCDYNPRIKVRPSTSLKSPVPSTQKKKSISNERNKSKNDRVCYEDTLFGSPVSSLVNSNICDSGKKTKKQKLKKRKETPKKGTDRIKELDSLLEETKDSPSRSRGLSSVKSNALYKQRRIQRPQTTAGMYSPMSNSVRKTSKNKMLLSKNSSGKLTPTVEQTVPRDSIMLQQQLDPQSSPQQHHHQPQRAQTASTIPSLYTKKSKVGLSTSSSSSPLHKTSVSHINHHHHHMNSHHHHHHHHGNPHPAGAKKTSSKTSSENWIPHHIRSRMLQRDLAVAKQNLIEMDIYRNSTLRSAGVGSSSTSSSNVDPNHNNKVTELERSLSKEKYGIEQRRKCGLCELHFLPINLVMAIPLKAVFDIRASWGNKYDPDGLKKIRVNPNLRKAPACYNETRVCAFCAQLFDKQQEKYRPSWEAKEEEQRRLRDIEEKRRQKILSDPLAQLQKERMEFIEELKKEKDTGNQKKRPMTVAGPSRVKHS